MNYTQLTVESQSDIYMVRAFIEHMEGDGPLFSLAVDTVRVNGTEIDPDSSVTFDTGSNAELDVEYVPSVDCGQIQRANITL